MPDIEEVADRVFRFETPIPGVTNIFAVYIINEPEAVLIEPGPAAAVPLICQRMKSLGLKDLAYIIPTHIHMDHAGGAGTLARLYPRAKVLVHPKAERHAINPSRLLEGTRAAFGADFETRYGPIESVPKAQVKVPRDSEIVSVNGRQLQVMYAPGHAQHHIAVFDRSVRGLFCGEALGMLVDGAVQFALPSVAPPNFDQAQYLNTMHRLRQLYPRVLFYSHGGVGHDPDVLISIAAENTRLLGEIILKGLKESTSPNTIGGRINDYLADRFGMRFDQTSLSMIVGGYTLYFKSTGLVQGTADNVD